MGLAFQKNKNIIFARMKALRKKSHLSQENLAAKMQLRNIDINQQAISLMECNKRFASDFEVACMCEIFKVDPSELLDDFAELGKLPEE